MNAKTTMKRAERVLGKGTTRRLIEAADATLVRLGHAAEDRQRRRATKRALTKAAAVAAAVGAGAAAVIITRKALRPGRKSRPRT